MQLMYLILSTCFHFFKFLPILQKWDPPCHHIMQLTTIHYIIIIWRIVLGELQNCFFPSCSSTALHLYQHALDDHFISTWTIRLGEFQNCWSTHKLVTTWLSRFFPFIEFLKSEGSLSENHFIFFWRIRLVGLGVFQVCMHFWWNMEFLLSKIA